MLDDKQLIEEFRKGSESAIELLIKRHYDKVFAYIYRSTWDYHIACDLSQTVFERTVTGLGGYRSERGAFLSWLLTIAVNTCRNYFRSSAFRTTRRQVALDETMSADFNVVSLLERKEEQAIIRNALQELPALQREVIILRIYHELAFKEIAEVTGSGESTVKSRYRQGLSKLKKRLERSERDAAQEEHGERENNHFA
ncbi:RNA polymerase sigma factor [Paenibacillus zanthoxyli]|uniref:RNA polymerase sigma factor n=1 Tax=Paenibacillus zanthoxyli TaxID=369399 RepID=UPI000472A9C6|nr:RNA polymerase sigma factor [Paenibacillus zanthoxyli]